MRSWRTRAVVAATVVALSALSACGGDPEPDSPPDDPPSSEEPDPDAGPLTGKQLREALLEIDDIPRELGRTFAKIQGTHRTGSEEMLAGPQECADYLDGNYGPDETNEYRVEYRDEDTVSAVYSTIRLFDEGEATDELDALRDLFEICQEFQIDVGGDAVDTFVVATGVDLFEDLVDLTDEGLYLNFELSLDGEPLRLMRYLLLRVDDLISFVGIQVAPDVDVDPLVDLALTAVDKLHAVAEQAP